MSSEAQGDADLTLHEITSVVTDLHGVAPKSVTLDSHLAEEARS